MLGNLIEKAQKGDKDAMMELIDRFQPIFRKYARKLNYEDAYQDTILYFIEFVNTVHLKDMNCLKDEAIVSYINTSVINFYNKKIHKVIESHREIAMSELTAEQLYHVEARAARRDEADFFMELGIMGRLNQNEYKIVYMVYVEGYTTAEIARRTKKTRQSVNQIKKRALSKLKRFLMRR